MKKFTAAMLAFVMMAAMLTGCGCMNSAAPTDATVMPTILPTTQATRPSEARPTQETTMPTRQPTSPSEGTGAADPSGMMGSDDTTGTTETTTPMTKESGRVRSHINGDF